MNNSRYSRQQRVSRFGENSQAKLQNAKVLVVGAGGLGSPLSLFLAGAGVGQLILVDDDVVSLSNLHRQILYAESDIGRSKVMSAATRLKMLNSEIEVECVNAALSANNVESLVDRASVVVDAADNFLVSYLLSDACFSKRIPFITASAIGTHGYLGVFCGTKDRPAPSLRAVFASPSKTAANCDTAGVSGPTVGIVASYQAQEVLKVILNDESQLLAKLMYLDLWDYSQNIIDFSGASEPDCHAPIIPFSRIGSSDILIDVRSESEAKDKPIVGVTVNIPNTQLEQNLQKLDCKRKLVCVCASGQRALGAANLLISKGFPNVYVTNA